MQSQIREFEPIEAIIAKQRGLDVFDGDGYFVCEVEGREKVAEFIEKRTLSRVGVSDNMIDILYEGLKDYYFLLKLHQSHLNQTKYDRGHKLVKKRDILERRTDTLPENSRRKIRDIDLSQESDILLINQAVQKVYRDACIRLKSITGVYRQGRLFYKN
jgi:hypothetical protein